MPNLGAPELIILLVVVFLLFGAKKLPDLARSIGRSTSEFKKGVKEGGQDGESDSKTAGSKADEPDTADKQTE